MRFYVEDVCTGANWEVDKVANVQVRDGRINLYDGADELRGSFDAETTAIVRKDGFNESRSIAEEIFQRYVP